MEKENITLPKQPWCDNCFWFGKEIGYLLAEAKHREFIVGETYYYCEKHYNERRIKKIFWEIKRQYCENTKYYIIKEKNIMTEIKTLLSGSKLEGEKFKKERLKLLNEVKQLKKKWILIYSSFIIVWILLGILFITIKMYPALVGVVIGLGIFTLNIYSAKSDYNYQVKKIQETEQLEDKIVEEIKKQEVLETKLNKNNE